MNKLENIGMVMVPMALVGALGYKAPGWLDEQNALNHLQTLDSSEEYMMSKEARLKAQLEKQKPDEAKGITAHCSVALNNCLDGVQMPKAQSCTQPEMNVRTFHETVAKPRESHILAPQPEVYKCDLVIQSAINKCHEEALYCLEKPLR